MTASDTNVLCLSGNPEVQSSDAVFADAGRALLAVTLPLIAVMCINVFGCVFTCTTFSRWRCLCGRRCLRKVDLRRDPRKTFGRPGDSVTSRPTTAGGCSFVIIMTVALLKLLWDVDQKTGKDACVVSMMDAPDEPSSADAALELPASLDAIRLSYDFVFFQQAANETCGALLAPGSAFLSHFPASFQGVPGVFSCAARPWDGGNAMGTLYQMASLAGTGPSSSAAAGAMFDVGDAVVLSVRPPVSAGFVGVASLPDYVPEYAVSGQCLDLGLLTQQYPDLALLKLCGYAGRPDYATTVTFGDAMQGMQSPTRADIRDWQYTSADGELTTEENALVSQSTLHRCQALQLPAARRKRHSNANAGDTSVTSDAADTRAHTAYPRSARGLYSRVTPVALHAGGTYQSNLFILSIMSTLQCVGRMLPPGGPSLSPDAPTTVLMGGNSSNFWPACATASGALHPTASNRTFRPYAPLPSATRDPAALGTSAGLFAWIACPSVLAQFMTSLAGIGGLLVFHPFLRMALLKLRDKSSLVLAAETLSVVVASKHGRAGGDAGGGQGGGGGGGSGGGGGGGLWFWGAADDTANAERPNRVVLTRAQRDTSLSRIAAGDTPVPLLGRCCGRGKREKCSISALTRTIAVTVLITGVLYGAAVASSAYAAGKVMVMSEFSGSMMILMLASVLMCALCALCAWCMQLFIASSLVYWPSVGAYASSMLHGAEDGRRDATAADKRQQAMHVMPPGASQHKKCQHWVRSTMCAFVLMVVLVVAALVTHIAFREYRGTVLLDTSASSVLPAMYGVGAGFVSLALLCGCITAALCLPYVGRRADDIVKDTRRQSMRGSGSESTLTSGTNDTTSSDDDGRSGRAGAMTPMSGGDAGGGHRRASSSSATASVAVHVDNASGIGMDGHDMSVPLLPRGASTSDGARRGGGGSGGGGGGGGGAGSRGRRAAGSDADVSDDDADRDTSRRRGKRGQRHGGAAGDEGGARYADDGDGDGDGDHAMHSSARRRRHKGSSRHAKSGCCSCRAGCNEASSVASEVCEDVSIFCGRLWRLGVLGCGCCRSGPLRRKHFTGFKDSY